MNRSIVASVLVACAAVAGCTRAPEISPWQETLTQVSTYGALQAGEFDGRIAVSNLLAYGDTGLGTFHGLDGEMIIESGRVWRAAADGTLHSVPGDTLVPFANLTWMDPDILLSIGESSMDVLVRTLGWKLPRATYPYAIRIEGFFPSIRYRSVAGYEPPYPALAEVVANGQRIHEATNVMATLVGFMMPQGGGAWFTEGAHLHMVTADRTRGGHVLDFRMRAGNVIADETPEVRIVGR